LRPTKRLSKIGKITRTFNTNEKGVGKKIFRL
jgi:hypothetical protein